MCVPMGPAVPNCELGSAGSRGCGHRHVLRWLLSSPGYSKEPKCIAEDSWVKAGLQKAMHSRLSVQTCAYLEEFIWVCFSISPGTWVDITTRPAIPSGSVTWPLGDSHQTRGPRRLRQLRSLLTICFMILPCLW